MRVADEVAEALCSDWRQADLDEADAALCALADALGRDPCADAARAVARLRAAGLDDRAIHDAVCVVAYFHFVNRIACGLGVELEEDRGGP